MENERINRYQLDKAIKKYHGNMCKYIRMNDELNLLKVAASTTQYGIEAMMPKAVGCISDPVYAHLQIRAKREVRIKKIKAELLLVQGLINKIKGDIELEVLYWLLEGMSFRFIGEELNISHTSVQRARERIINMMLR